MKNFRIAAKAILSLLALPFTSPAQDPLTNGLVAFYPFNESANDESGNGNHGAIIGFDWKYFFDRFGGSNSLYLNTTSNPTSTFEGTYVVAPRSASLDFSTNFTLSVWLNLPAGLIYHVHNLVSNGRDNSGANLRVVSGADDVGRDYFQYVHSGPESGRGEVHALVPSLASTWFHFVAVRSGTNMSLFRNGSLLTNGVLTSAVVNGPEIWLGRMICPGFPTTCEASYSMLGGIDDVRMYNRALSASEVLQLFQYEANPLPYLTIAVKTVRLGLYVEPGSTYQLYSTTDLGGLIPYGPPFVATNSIVYQDVDVLDGQQYFRIALVPP